MPEFCNDFLVIASAVCLSACLPERVLYCCFYAFYPRCRCRGNKGILTSDIAWMQNFSVIVLTSDESCSEQNCVRDSLSFSLVASAVLFSFC